MRNTVGFVLVLALVASACFAKGGAKLKADLNKPRIVVMTDFSTLSVGSGEPDDTESMVRFLLYSNDFDVEGLIATGTNGRPSTVNAQFIRAIVGEYGKVRGNLLKHDKRYPTAECLLERVKAGLTEEVTGPGKDTEGSDWIISVVDNPDPRPVWFTIWGGPRELAQALWKVQQTRTPEQFAKFRRKIRVYAIGDQDPTGPWIRETFPDLFYIKGSQVYRGMYRDGDTSLAGPEWVETNITKDHGPLGAAYPNYNGGDPWGRVRGIKEGDTPSFLYLVPNGLGSPEQPTWGSWGGRFSGDGPQYFDAKDTIGSDTSERATVYRWRPAYQADFQARLDWCVKPYKEANHPPKAIVKGDPTRTAAPGAEVKLDASGSSDPDGDKLSYDWSFYREPSSYQGELAISNCSSKQASFVAPTVDSPKTIHVILTVTDGGSPALSRYKRVLVTVDPARKVK